MDCKPNAIVRIFRARGAMFACVPEEAGGVGSSSSSDSVALAGGVVGGGESNSPILGRSDDWPLAWPGDARPYFDYLLVVFSGDDIEAMDKRDNMREVCISST